ncbi:MAG: ornithine cyclodeaminase family protein [Acidilobaceae archaeon]
MVLGVKEIDKLVNVNELIEDIEKVLLEAPKPPPRTSLETEGSWFGVMPARGLGFYSVKLVGVYYRNPERGLPLIRGLLVLVDSETGEVLLEADAGPATAWRTASASALAMRLAGFRKGVLGVIGAGVQGRYHILVFREVFNISKVLIFDIDKKRAESLASEVGGLVAESSIELLRSSDIVIAATTSRSPVVLGEFLKSGAFVVSVGAPKPVRELDETTIKRSRCLLVDSVEGVMTESDDWIGAEELVSLSDTLRGKECKWGDVRVYKSVGYSLFDLAVAIHLYKRVSRGSR